jgi:hypothetical protein
MVTEHTETEHVTKYVDLIVSTTNAILNIFVRRRYSRTPPMRALDIRVAGYPDRLGPSGKFVENST